MAKPVLLATVWLALAGGGVLAEAEPPPPRRSVLIELFTSQG